MYDRTESKVFPYRLRAHRPAMPQKILPDRTLGEGDNVGMILRYVLVEIMLTGAMREQCATEPATKDHVANERAAIVEYDDQRPGRMSRHRQGATR